MSEREIRILRAIAENLRAISEEMHALHEEQQTTATTVNVPPPWPIPIHIEADPRMPMALREYYEAENRYRNSKRRKLKAILDSVGIFSALAVAILTLLTFQQIVQQTASFRVSARGRSVSTSCDRAI